MQTQTKVAATALIAVAAAAAARPVFTGPPALPSAFEVTVVDGSSGAPLPNARIVVAEIEDEQLDGVLDALSGSTNAAGFCSLSYPSTANLFAVHVVAPGYASAYGEVSAVSLETLHVTLDSSAGFVYVGQLTGANGAGARIDALDGGQETVALADATGLFACTIAPSTEVDLRATSPFLRSHAWTVSLAASMQLGDPDLVAVQAATHSRVAGTVLLQSNGAAPPLGTTVRVWDPSDLPGELQDIDFLESVAVESDGSFELVTDLENGRFYYVTATHAGKWGIAAVTPPLLNPVDVVLGDVQNAGLYVLPLAEDGPFASGTVTLHVEDVSAGGGPPFSFPVARAAVAATGVVTFAPLLAGEYRTTWESETEGSAAAQVFLPAGVATTAYVAVPAHAPQGIGSPSAGTTGAVVGTVQMHGSGLSYAHLALVDPHGQEILAEAETDASGVYAFTGVVTGTYDLVAFGEDDLGRNALQLRGEQSVQVLDMQTAVVDVDLYPTPGVVVEAWGVDAQVELVGPIAGATIELLDGATVVASTSTDGEGLAAFGQVPVTVDAVRITHSSYQPIPDVDPEIALIEPERGFQFVAFFMQQNP